MKRMFLFILPLAALLFGIVACDDESDYLVRETDNITFYSGLASSKEITLRCQGSWRTVVPSGSEWISTSPSEGVGDGSFTWITVSVTHNRGDKRTGTIYLENGGVQYPITVTQADGAVIYGTPYIDGTIFQGVVSTARLCFPYENAYGDEVITVTCDLSEDCAGLSVGPANVSLSNGSGTAIVSIDGTAASSGYVTYDVMVDGVSIGSVRDRVYSTDESPLEGLPVSWMFCEEKGSTIDQNELELRQPHWATDGENYLVNDEDGRSYMYLVEADGKTATALNGWAYNDGHAYVKGLYYNDYWLMTIPVKNLVEGDTLNVCGSFGGSGSSAGFYIIEYSDDGQTWYDVPGTITDTFNDTEVTYHCEALDSYNAVDGWFSYDFPVSFSIDYGTLYIRFRVCANVRVTRNNTITTGGGGSSRLKGTFKVALAE